MAVFRNVTCPLCKAPAPTIKSTPGLGGGGDVTCTGCGQRISYFYSVEDADTL